MDIYPRYPKRIALNAIAAAFPIPVDNMRLRVCLTIGGEAAALKRLDPLLCEPLWRAAVHVAVVVLIGFALILGYSNKDTGVRRT